MFIKSTFSTKYKNDDLKFVLNNFILFITMIIYVRTDKTIFKIKNIKN